ncbi:Inositol-3-phosphate synthase [Phytophthora palmivora]|uniref:Inositol-3-phosphate synthase n=1 Tax=Phytophthora palmivora TaxID=4796 RepID=A0A2P4XCJ6_9STRA|nr:Inositol-3-phosphate synthase [Phytophthora palmivora]
MYKWVAHYVKTCETCQRVKPSGHASAPLQSLPVPADCWKSMSLDFGFGLPADDKGSTGILVFVCRLSKMVHLAPVRGKVPGKQAAQLFLDSVLRGEAPMPPSSPKMSPRLKQQLSSFIDNSLMLISWVRYTKASAQDKQKEYSDKRRQGNLIVFNVGDLVLLDTAKGESNKLKHRFIRPFAVLTRHGTAYTIDLPKSMTTHPTLYVGRLKRYHYPLGLSPRTEEDQGEDSPPRNKAKSSVQPELPVSEPANENQAGTHASHTKGMTVPHGKSSRKSHTHKPSGTSTPAAHKRASDHAPHGSEHLSLDGSGSRNSAVNTPMELSGLTTKSVQIMTKDL